MSPADPPARHVPSALISSSEAARRLRARSHRMTRVRRAVIEEIFGSRRHHHFTSCQLRARVPAVARASIYNTLQLLVEEALICQLVIGRQLYFDTDLAPHGHRYCSQTRVLADFDGATGVVASAYR